MERNVLMDRINKKHAFSLGVKVGIVFLVTVAAVLIVAYYALSQNFQGLMTDYTLKLVEAMTDQGVQMVENELDTGKQEASFLADAFKVPDLEGDEIQFPQSYTKGGHLRMVYATQNGTIASDGRQRDIRDRQDIRSAFAGEASVYGPYFNEEDEFVVCYTAPVRQDGNIVGALSVEKDGYRFCELIKNIRFIDSGESYIINAQGTDIAVSDQNHIEWVDAQYNAQKLYKENAAEETKSIIELEKKGLNGETGLGTYYWKKGLVYVYYRPIPSVDWVLLAGLRKDEIVSMTRTALFATVSQKPILGICLLLVFLLTVLIMYWIISSMKRDVEINERLKNIANYDSLTGLMNRNSYNMAIEKISKEECRSMACVYIDVNGLHEINNHLGHKAGDEMLRTVAAELCRAFPQDEVYRIGGDEFVVLCWGQSKQDVCNMMEQVRLSLRSLNYEISIGIAWKDSNVNTAGIINEAESAMQQDKAQFYKGDGNERRMRNLDEQLEKMIVEKQDADTFLEVLAPQFKGVYFVNLSSDTIRHLYIPLYFEECLREAGDQFSKAIMIYARKIVKPEYYHYFEEMCDYENLEKCLNSNQMPEFVYQKTNGDWLNLRVLKFKEYTDKQRETLWIFTNTKGRNNT